MPLVKVDYEPDFGEGGTLTAVDYEPEFEGTLTPVDGDPFAPISPGPKNMFNSGMGGGFLGLLPPAKGSAEDRSQEAMADTIIDQLPMLGATVATIGIPGAGAFTQGAIPFLKFAGQSALQAATGGGIGGAVESAATGQPIAKGAMDAAVEQGAADLAGSAVLKGVQVAGAPVARKISQEGSRALKFAVDKGLPANPVDIFPTWITKSVEKALDNWMPSRLGLKSKSKVIASALEIPPTGANQLILDAAMVSGKNAADTTDDAVVDAVRGIVSSIRPAVDETGKRGASLADEAYDAFYKAVGKDGFSMPSLQSALNDIETKELLNPIKDKAALSLISDLREVMGSGNLNGPQINNILTRLDDTGASAHNLGLIRDAVTNDLATAAGTNGAAKNALDNARAVAALGKEFASNPAVKKIVNKGSVDTVALFSQKNIGVIKQMRKRLPPDLYNELAAKNLENLINNTAIKTQNDTVKHVNGARLLDSLQRNREMFEAAYPKETIEALENLAVYARMHSGEITRYGGRFDKDDAIAMGSALAAAGTGLATGAGVPVVAGGIASYGIAKSVMDPTSTLFKWLTGTMGKEGMGSFLTRSGLRFYADDQMAEPRP